MSWFSRTPQVVTINETLVIAAAEMAAAEAASAEITKQVRDQLPGHVKFSMTSFTVAFSEINLREITCPQLRFEWK